jgi:glycosyltransferase involved in cell wall biosynthesis
MEEVEAMTNSAIPHRVWLATPGGWHLPNTAKAFEARGALAGLWISNKNSSALASDHFRRCWPFHLLLKPFLHLAPQLWTEKAFYALLPVWQAWLRMQPALEFDVVQAIMGFGTEPFTAAKRVGALKVLDCANSHPTTYFGYWQRECDLWCPGERVPIPRWMFARMNRELEMADLILCPSNFVRDSMLLNGFPESKCFVNPFGVDTSLFVPRAAAPTHSRFVNVGTICLRKGHQYLFRAFERVKAVIPEAELICVGDYKSDFRRERPRWKGTFTHYPNLTHPELAKLLQTCSAFVFPSTEEGFARVISEAMAAGLPIVASHESGASTRVTDGNEGFIVSPRDTTRLAEVMIQLARDPELNRRLGEAAHRKGAVRNTWQDYGDRLLAEFESRLAAKRKQC